MRRHIDAIQQAMTKLGSEIGKPSGAAEADMIVEKIQGVLRDECSMLEKEIGIGGDYPLRFMLTNAIACLAWSAYSIKKASLDQRRPFGEMLEMAALASGLGEVLDAVAIDAAAYAELSSQ